MWPRAHARMYVGTCVCFSLRRDGKIRSVFLFFFILRQGRLKALFSFVFCTQPLNLVMLDLLPPSIVKTWQTVQVGGLFLVVVCLPLPFPMHHTSKYLTDTGQSFVSLSEVELSSSSESSLPLPGLKFGVSPYFSLTLWPTRRLPGLLISHSSRKGQRARASWEKEQREGELPRQVKGSRKDILLICC